MQILRVFFLVGVLSCIMGTHALANEFTVYAGKVFPFTMVDAKGHVTGAAVDVVKAIMDKAGSPIDVDAIRTISWARAVEDTETVPGTMLFCMARTPQREERFKWVGPVAEVNLGLVAKVSSTIIINTPDDLKKYRIGAIRNSAPVDILEKKYRIPPSDLTLLSSDILQFRMLDSRRVDMITQADTAAPMWLEKINADQADFEMVYVLKELKLYVAFNKETDDRVVRRIQAALDELKAPGDDGESRYSRIMNRYLSQGVMAKQKRQEAVSQ